MTRRAGARVVDLHCHILPGVDDGAQNLEDSLRMIDAAKTAGVGSIVCTPHVRDPYFDYDKMWDAFDLLQSQTDMPLTMGWEVNHRKLMQLGYHWIDYLHTDGENVLLLELDNHCRESQFEDYERSIYQIQTRGYDVIVAHPERYSAIQKNPDLAERLVAQGCELQASSDFMYGGRLGKEKKPAEELFRRGLYTYIASDAHRVDHYRFMREAYDKFSSTLREPRRSTVVFQETSSWEALDVEPEPEKPAYVGKHFKKV